MPPSKGKYSGEKGVTSGRLGDHTSHWTDMHGKESVNLFAFILSREAEFCAFF